MTQLQLSICSRNWWGINPWSIGGDWTASPGACYMTRFGIVYLRRKSMEDKGPPAILVWLGFFLLIVLVVVICIAMYAAYFGG